MTVSMTYVADTYRKPPTGQADGTASARWTVKTVAGPLFVRPTS